MISIISTEPMEMKCLTIGDLHYKISNAADTNIMSSRIIKEAKEILPDIIVVLGDILDRFENIHMSPFNRAVKFLKELSYVAKTVILIGNHDRKNANDFLSEEHPFVGLEDSNILVCNVVKQLTVKGKLLTFVPYVPPGRFIEALDTIGEDKWLDSDCIFAHQEFKNAKMGAVLSKDGDEWPDDYPLIISGHVHDYDELQPNLIYTGTPMTHAYGDKTDKTISYLIFEEFINHIRIDLKLPKKSIIYIDCHDVGTYKLKTMDRVKIVIRGTPAEINVIANHVKINKWKKKGYVVSYRMITDESNVITTKKIKKRSYLDALKLEISKDESLINAFEYTFKSI